MTKNRSKKMTKSTFAIIIMAIVMVAMLAFGGTYAYFTAQATATVGTAKTGKVILAAGETLTLNQKVVPTEDLFGETQTMSIKSNSNVKTFVFVTITSTFAQDNAIKTANGYVAGTPTQVTELPGTFTEGNYTLTPALSETTTWASFTSGQTKVYYAVVDGADTEQTLEFCTGMVFDGHSESSNDKLGSLMNGTITVTVDASAIQYAGFENKTDAGFSETGKYATLADAAPVAYASATITE